MMFGFSKLWVRIYNEQEVLQKEQNQKNDLEIEKRVSVWSAGLEANIEESSYLHLFWSEEEIQFGRRRILNPLGTLCVLWIALLIRYKENLLKVTETSKRNSSQKVANKWVRWKGKL